MSGSIVPQNGRYKEPLWPDRSVHGRLLAQEPAARLRLTMNCVNSPSGGGPSLTPPLQQAGPLGWSPLRASNEGLLRPRVPRAQRPSPMALPDHVFQPASLLFTGGWPDWSPTARIERPQFHRGGSASKKGTWPLPLIFQRSRVVRAERLPQWLVCSCPSPLPPFPQ